MAENSSVRRTMSPWKVFLGVLCVLLAVFASTAQVVHMHTDGSATHANCSMCVAAHVSVHVVQATPAPVHAVRVATKVELVQPVRPASPLTAFALVSRPPPAA